MATWCSDADHFFVVVLPYALGNTRHGDEDVHGRLELATMQDLHLVALMLHSHQRLTTHDVDKHLGTVLSSRMEILVESLSAGGRRRHRRVMRPGLRAAHEMRCTHAWGWPGRG